MKNIIPKGERAGIRKTSSDTKGMSLKIKVISLFLAMSLIPLGIVGFMAYNNASSSMSELNSANSVALEHAAYNELEAVGQLKTIFRWGFIFSPSVAYKFVIEPRLKIINNKIFVIILHSFVNQKCAFCIRIWRDR